MKKFLLFILVVMFFAGCSGNLLKGIDSKSGDAVQKNVDAQNYLDQGDYTKAIESLQSQVATAGNVSSTTITNPTAEIIYAQAELGSKGFDAPTLLDNAVSNIKTDNNAAQNLQVVQDLLPDIDLTTLDDATDRLNAVSSSSMSSGEQLTAGIANALDAVLTVYDTFDTNGDGKLNESDSALNNATTAATAWNNIKTDVLNNADKAVTFTDLALTSSSETTTDLKDAISDAETQLNTISGNDAAILNALLSLDGSN